MGVLAGMRQSVPGDSSCAEAAARVAYRGLQARRGGTRIVSPGRARAGVDQVFAGEVFQHRGSSFLDVGANLGYFSCLLGKLAGPRGKVVAIEPEPNNFKLLQRNLRNN